MKNMRSRAKKKVPDIVFRNGKPAAVVLDIDQYGNCWNALKDAEDLRMLEKMRKRPLKFRKLEEFLKEYRSGV